jgi:hypothetical protein
VHLAGRAPAPSASRIAAGSGAKSGSSVEIYLGGIQVISCVILPRQVRAEPQRFDPLG